MRPISFMSANYVARQLNYNMTGGWGQGDQATNEYFRPIKTFGKRFEELLKEIKGLGFDAMDLWLAHLNPKWATEDHISQAQELLGTYTMGVVSLAGGFGSTPEEFEAVCELASAVGAPVLGGGTPLLQKERPLVVGMLQKYGLKLGIENHPEKTPKELLDKIGDGGEGTVGAAIDTGWFGTQGYDAAQAIRELGQHIFHVHLKDVLAAGAHDTCRLGQGIVPIQECMVALRQIGYTGAISIEHEPENRNPNDEVIASRAFLEELLQ